MILAIILSILALYGCEVSGKASCSDCVLLHSCQGAVNYAHITKKLNGVERRKKFHEAFCGMEVTSGKSTPKICCSAFNDYENQWTNNGTDSNGVTPNSEIYMHENLSLLPESCGDISRSGLRGIVAELYEFPWMALIAHKTSASRDRHNVQFQCGGSIINSRYILTAAHCVHNKVIAGVRIGEFDIRSSVDCQQEYPYQICESHVQDIPVEDIIAHDQYQQSPIENDIALLRLKTPIDFTYKNAKPICLPVHKELRERNITSGGEIGTVAGWGLSETGSESSVLRTLSFPILSDVACQEVYDRDNEPRSRDSTFNKICVGEMKKHSCIGDSGGPLMREDEVKGIYRMIQYGIMSYDPRQCVSSFPEIYTDVAKYMKWILDNLKP